MADTVYLVLHTLTHDGEESYGAEELILQRTQEMLAQEDADHRAELSDSDDYTALAYATIFHISYDLLASGKYNLQSTLNPLSPAPQLKRYVVRCLDWSVSAGQITEKEKEEQLLQLDREIRWH